MKTEINTIKKGLTEFWNSQFQYNLEESSCHIAYPLLLLDGWQLTFSMYKDSLQKVYTLSDNGKIFNFLQDNNVSGTIVKNIVEEKCKFFGIQNFNKELILKKTSLPTALEIELYAEGLQSIAYLVYRHEKAALQITHARKNFENFLKSRELVFKRDISISGKIIPSIKMDYQIEMKNNKKALCKITEVSTDLHNYMERWGFRFNQIKEANEDTRILMIYNPDFGKWDDFCLNIGQNICDKFTPYTNIEDITNFLQCA